MGAWALRADRPPPAVDRARAPPQRAHVVRSNGAERVNDRELRKHLLASRRASGVPDQPSKATIERIVAMLRSPADEVRAEKLAAERKQRAS